MTHASPSVVDVAWLKAHLHDPRVRVVDVRWSLAAPGRAAYDAAHVPGASFLDLDRDLSAPHGPGRHPIPDVTQVARVFGEAGVGPETHVVAYDDAGGSVAARVWFLLRRHGHARVSILDGGIPAWIAAGGEVTAEVPHVTPRELALAPAPADDVLDKDAVRALTTNGGAVLIDVRAAARYRGEVEPIDARPGHIPTAKNVPWSDNLAPNGDGVPVLRAPSELRALYAAAGVGDASSPVLYCGSSVTACFGLLALERAGLGQGRVYEGSWSDWARDPALPAARGTE